MSKENKFLTNIELLDPLKRQLKLKNITIFDSFEDKTTSNQHKLNFFITNITSNEYYNP
jgi:hypothetical protein